MTTTRKEEPAIRFGGRFRRCSGTVGRYLKVPALLLSCTILSFLPAAQSQEAASQKRIEVVHKVPNAKSLPSAAAMMPLIIELKGTKSIDQKVRLVGSRDGKLIDIVFPRGTLNMADVPTYKLDLPAPIALLSYQFVIHQPDGTLTSTPQFTLKRPCIQTFKVDVPENQRDASFKRDVATLVAKSRTLEQETNNLDTALRLLDEIKSNLP